jgi:hypothetical protein
LFTNATVPFSDDGLKTIIDSLRRQDIVLDAIGPTWTDDSGDDHHGEVASATARPTTNGSLQQTRKPLSVQQRTGMRVISQIVDQTEGNLFTFRSVSYDE